MAADALLGHLLDSLKDPFVFCDTDHVIRYWNARGAAAYAKRGADIGYSILDCHNETSCAQIIEIAERFSADPALDEVLITDSKRHRVWMRAVRDTDGTLLGYYERFEPPAGS
jgi:PAS domain-containing protein